MTTICRFGEQSRTWFRSDRYYRINQKWYFSTREGVNKGPFETISEAEADLSIHIRTQRLLGNANTDSGHELNTMMPFTCR